MGSGILTFESGSILQLDFKRIDPTTEPFALTLFDFSGGYSGVAPEVQFLNGSSAADWSFDHTSGVFTFTSAIPEPSSLILLTLAGVALMSRRQR